MAPSGLTFLPLLALGAAVVIRAEDCCGKCLNDVTNFAYNPMDFIQCQAAQLCCFHCSDVSIGSPTVLPVAGTTFAGTTITATTGSFFQIQWPKATMITYVTFAPGQAKAGIPLLSSSQATKSGNAFRICPQYAGTLYYRGFGSDTCKSVSVEYAVTVVSGVDGSNCGAAPTPAPSDGGSTPTPGGNPSPPSSTSSQVADCNPARGTVINGACVCASDWTGPPACAGTPVWKWLVTIGGGVAALFSIVISIRAFLASRKAKRQKSMAALAAEHPSSPKKISVEMETLRMSEPERAESTDVPYDKSDSSVQEVPDPSSTRPPSKEYTL
ncbi:Aste57867_15431 [Aphanomyces stellatus]|uniref:Aste57867_15431 protein n=1 Tax=Aphanomyces stellatus TaxID=120398 RepID=A0A485L3D5_9STRA|nr:hypothetical protein As57867_015375 [Aphanomyces stellatus]VFT92233.1 Aste57867_15431 [Aphanomyces stellatus]